MILKYRNPAYGRGDALRCGGPMRGLGFIDSITNFVTGVVKGATDLVTAPARTQNEQLAIQKEILSVQAMAQQQQSDAAARITAERADSIKTLALVGGGTIAVIAVAAALRSRM